MANPNARYNLRARRRLRSSSAPPSPIHTSDDLESLTPFPETPTQTHRLDDEEVRTVTRRSSELHARRDPVDGPVSAVEAEAPAPGCDEAGSRVSDALEIAVSSHSSNKENASTPRETSSSEASPQGSRPPMAELECKGRDPSTDVLTTPQRHAVVQAEKDLTTEQWTRIQNRPPMVPDSETSEASDSVDVRADSISLPSGDVAGPSRDKGKGVDPHNWGALDLPDDELDPIAQQVVLDSWTAEQVARKSPTVDSDVGNKMPAQMSAAQRARMQPSVESEDETPAPKTALLRARALPRVALNAGNNARVPRQVSMSQRARMQPSVETDDEDEMPPPRPTTSSRPVRRQPRAESDQEDDCPSLQSVSSDDESDNEDYYTPRTTQEKISMLETNLRTHLAHLQTLKEKQTPETSKRVRVANEVPNTSVSQRFVPQQPEDVPAEQPTTLAGNDPIRRLIEETVVDYERQRRRSEKEKRKADAAAKAAAPTTPAMNAAAQINPNSYWAFVQIIPSHGRWRESTRRLLEFLIR